MNDHIIKMNRSLFRCKIPKKEELLRTWNGYCQTNGRVSWALSLLKWWQQWNYHLTSMKTNLCCLPSEQIISFVLKVLYFVFFFVGRWNILFVKCIWRGFSRLMKGEKRSKYINDDNKPVLLLIVSEEQFPQRTDNSLVTILEIY